MTGKFNSKGTLYTNKSFSLLSRLFDGCESLLTGPNILAESPQGAGAFMRTF